VLFRSHIAINYSDISDKFDFKKFSEVANEAKSQ